MVMFVLLVEEMLLKAELKYALAISGEQCVMTFGALLMPEWFVANWAIQPMVYLYNKIIVHGCFES